MRSLKVIGILLAVFAVISIAAAKNNSLGIRDTYTVRFETPVRVADSLLPAGDYTIRHTMEGPDHIMVFQLTNHKGAEVKAKCSLVQLPKKADISASVFSTNSANERVLRELVFRGDLTKHVF